MPPGQPHQYQLHISMLLSLSYYFVAVLHICRAVSLWSADKCDTMDILDMVDLINSVVGPDNNMFVAVDIDRSRI